MRLVLALGLSLSRSWKLPAAISALPSTQVRHGSQRTHSTPHYSPQDWTRDRSQKIPRSLYYQADDWVAEPVYPDIEPRKDTPAWVKFTREKEGKQLEQMTIKQKMEYFIFAPPPLKFDGTKLHPDQHEFDRRRQFWMPYEIPGFPLGYWMTPFYQYITNTAIVSDQLPKEYYSFLDDVTLNGIVEKIREPVTKALIAEGKYYTKNLTNVPEEDQNVVVQAQNVIDAITRAVDLAVGKDYPHLRELQRDLETQCTAYWKRSGYQLENQHEFTIDKVSGEVKFQYIEDGLVYRAFRHELPLPAVVPRTSSTVGSKIGSGEDSTVIDVPKRDQNPYTHGYEAKDYVPHWIPGFWFGDPCGFSTLSLTVPRKWTTVVDKFGEETAFENMTANAVIAGFGRIVAQAMFLGFSILNELTYPIVTQSILTNGRDWMFSIYQANTIAVWKQDSDNPYRNLAWITKPISLFERIEEDKVVGLNEEVIRNIVRQYLKSPQVDPELNLRPYVAGNPLMSYWKTETGRVPFYRNERRKDGKLQGRIPKIFGTEI